VIWNECFHEAHKVLGHEEEEGVKLGEVKRGLLKGGIV
jgi:hypothetical protein